MPSASDAPGIIITEQLALRGAGTPDYLREKLAIQDLAAHMADHPTQVLPRLVRLAMEACEATSAGVSVLEPDDCEFRWLGLHGALSAFEGARTPRNNSPCGVTLDRNFPVLMRHPERIYSWISDAGIIVPEVLLVPLKARTSDMEIVLGTIWVVADQGKQFDSGHARVLTELASFAGVALRMIQAEERAIKALNEQEQLTREMSHRVKNLFAITDSMIRMTARTTESKDDLVQKLSGRLHALAAANSLVRRNFGDPQPDGVTLREAIETVLRPYEQTACHGPAVNLGDHATNSIALIFHEFATNAAKYGALSVATGQVDVRWTASQDNLVIAWNESGGPQVCPPSRTGFGTSLVEATTRRHAGSINCDWRPSGLIASITLPLSSLVR